MTRGTKLVCLLLCLPSCKDDGVAARNDSAGSASAVVTASATASAGSVAKLDARLAGEPLPLKTAVAYAEGGAAIELTFSTAAPDCEDFADDGRVRAEGERSFSLTLRPMLTKDGGTSWQIGRAYFEGHSRQAADIGELTIREADPHRGVKGEMSFELELKASDSEGPPPKLVVKGPFAARGCGVFAPKDLPPSRPQKDLILKIAGKRFTIDGAIVTPTRFPTKGYELVLSSTPISCESAMTGADLKLKLNIGDGGPATFAFMAGNILPTQLNVTPPDGRTITAEPKGPLGGDGEVAIELRGEIDILGYAVSLDGSAQALRCPEK